MSQFAEDGGYDPSIDASTYIIDFYGRQHGQSSCFMPANNLRLKDDCYPEKIMEGEGDGDLPKSMEWEQKTHVRLA